MCLVLFHNIKYLANVLKGSAYDWALLVALPLSLLQKIKTQLQKYFQIASIL